MKGKLIVLEGLDGSGKSTQFERLRKLLAAQGEKVCGISFPDYKEPSSALVKMYLNGEFGNTPDSVNAYAASVFYAIDRYACYRRFWEDDYHNGTVILAARYVTSNAIYQMTKLPEEEWNSYLDWLEEFEYGKLELPKPDCVFFLDMPPEVSQKLLAGRYEQNGGKKDIHESNVAFLKKCREAAQYASKRWGWQWISCAEGNSPRSIEAIAEDLTVAVQTELKKSETESAERSLVK